MFLFLLLLLLLIILIYLYFIKKHTIKKHTILNENFIVNKHWSFIDKIVYINLNSRPDRNMKMKEMLSVIPDQSKIIRFSAIKFNKGYIGCSLSHIKVLKMAIKNNWKNVLIMEDDATWNDYNNGYSRLVSLIQKYPNFDVITLGNTFTTIDKDTSRLIDGQTTVAYIVNNHYYNTLLNNFVKGIYKLKESDITEKYAIDQYWKKLMKKDKWYIVHPCLVYQRPDKSDIVNLDVDYKKWFNIELFEKNELYNKKNIFTYWTGKKYFILNIFFNIMKKFSQKYNYNFILMNESNCYDYIDLPDNFSKFIPSHQSDILRIKVINKYGGIWLDADTLVLDSLDSLFHIFDTYDAFFILEDGNNLCSGVFGSKPGTKIMKKWVEDIDFFIHMNDIPEKDLEWTSFMNFLEDNRNIIEDTSYIFDGLQNIYPIPYYNTVKEYMNKPYINYKNIIRSYQPLLVLSNTLYKAIEEKKTYKNMPIEYFINLAYSNMN